MDKKITLNLIFTSILILEYYLIYNHFNKRAYYSKIGLLFLMYIVVSSFKSYYIFVNNGFILFIILLFYYNKELKMKKQSKLIIKNENKITNNDVESFSDYKKLKQLKQLHKYKIEESTLNSTNIKNKKIKEKKSKERFNNSYEHDNESKSIEEYKKEFEKYKFNRPVKSSIDALNKIPYFIEQFKAIWE